MTQLLLAAALSAALAAPPSQAPAAASQPKPAPAAAPAEPRAPEGTPDDLAATPRQEEPAPVLLRQPPAPPPAAKATEAALRDARGALLGPCSPAMADATVKAVSVIGGKAMNAILAAAKAGGPAADAEALFLVVEYTAGSGAAKDYRQISTAHGLTTAQAQVLVGEKLCVFGKP